MKLRTRIIWICCLSIFGALLAGDIIIWILAYRNMMNEALTRAYGDSFLVANDFQERLLQAHASGVDSDKIYLEYLLKSYQDDYNVCIYYEDYQAPETAKEAYNHTIFSMEDFLDQKYSAYYGELSYAAARWNHTPYIIFQYNYEGHIFLYRLCDVSAVEDRFFMLVAAMASLLVVLTAAASIILRLVLKRVLRPLKELNETTKRMADNDYGQRVAIRRMDEIGELGESFNKMAEAVEARAKSLEESERKKTLFMGDLTHELKTPLTAISGYAQTLLAVKISKEEEQEALLYIDEECKRLSKLSRKMMRLLELDRDVELELALTPVRELFGRTEHACKAVLEEKRLTLAWEEHGEMLPMDVELMTDMLINLVDNAAKASVEGGKIVLRAWERRIEVEDFGQGIPEEELERIMEPFYMVDKSRSRRTGGSGLGLALVAMIAKRHGIRIEIDSRLGEGTRFILQFV